MDYIEKRELKMEDVKTDKKESLDLIHYRLTAIESTLAEMKNLLLTTKLQNQRLDTLEDNQRKIEKKVDKNEEEISSIKSFPTKEKADKFDSIVNLIFKVFITAVVSYACVKIGLK